LIIKSLIVPIFTYVASACVVPEKYRKEIDSKCFKFIWNNKPDKVKNVSANQRQGRSCWILHHIEKQQYFSRSSGRTILASLPTSHALVLESDLNSKMVTLGLWLVETFLTYRKTACYVTRYYRYFSLGDSM
jgi:hypothetical protein